MVVGRQRITFDDQRFIGAVQWRQNEQTFDSAYGESSFGIKGVKARYGYIWDVKRIFADKGNNPARQDFDNGRYEFDQDWGLDYILSYAYLTDSGDNPIDYDAHYVWASLDVGYDPLGRLGLGYEMFGSDDNDAHFVTPIATAHKFNGFADVWLDNGGVGGLEDLFMSIAPRLPWGPKGELIYHRFWSEFSNANLGDEIDAVLWKKLGHGFSVFSKGAYYDSTGASRNLGRNDTWRWSIQLDYDF